MAKFKLYEDIGELNWVTGRYYNLSVESQSAKKLELVSASGDRIVYSGKGFGYDGDTPTKGTVSKVELQDADGDPLLTITGGDFKLQKISISDVSANFDMFEAGNDKFIGSAIGDFILYGSNDGNDTIKGKGGNDYIAGSDGRNKIDGGAGDRDVLSYEINSDGPRGVKVDLDAGKATNPWGKTDTIKGIEDIRGTQRNDVLIGSKHDDYLLGVGGNDRLTGGNGNDEFSFYASGDKDRITDFGRGDDMVVLGGFDGVETFKDVKMLLKQKGDDTVLDLGNGDVLTFLDFDKKDFNSKDFEFEY